MFIKMDIYIINQDTYFAIKIVNNFISLVIINFIMAYQLIKKYIISFKISFIINSFNEYLLFIFL